MKKKIAAWLTIIKVKKCAKYITLNIIHITYSTLRTMLEPATMHSEYSEINIHHKIQDSRN